MITLKLQYFVQQKSWVIIDLIILYGVFFVRRALSLKTF